MTDTPWDELLKALKAHYGAEDSPLDLGAQRIIRNWFEMQYAKGRMAGAVEEAARYRR